MADLKLQVLICMTLTLLFTSFVSGKIQRALSCPAEDLGQTILLPHPNCSYFYKCFNGAAYEQSCPPGLQWNVQINACDWANAANCTDGEAPEQPGPVDPPGAQPPVGRPPIHDSCPEANPDYTVHLPHPDCSLFYKCLDGVPYIYECPPGLQWSIQFDRCDWPNIANCTDGASPEQPGAVPPGEAPPGGAPPGNPVRPPIHDSCPEVDPSDYTVHLPHPDCTMFYKCLAGVPYEIYCLPGLHWSIDWDRCEWPGVANCTDGASPEQPGAVPPGEGPPGEGPPGGGPAGEAPARPPIHDSCPAVDPPNYTVHLPHPDCTMFYKCLAGVPYEIYCLPGLHWSIDWDRCEWPGVANCTNGDSPEQPGAVPPGEGPGEGPPVEGPIRPPIHDSCPAIDPPNYTVHLPHPNCAYFYKCLGGFAHELPCQPGLQWSIEFDRCEWPNTASCTDGAAPEQPGPPPTVPTEPPTITELPPNSDSCPGTGVHFLPHPNCSLYYRCIDGVPTESPCPPTLHWSIELNQCDWPDTANCVEGQAPEQ